MIWMAAMANSTTVKRGRPPIADPLIFKTVGLTALEWEWLATWHPEGNVTNQLSELVERSRKFWPSGPTKFR